MENFDSLPEACLKCSLTGRPRVFGSGTPGGIVVIGEAPGTTEVIKKMPFVGKSGKLLRESLKLVNIDPEKVWYTNACLCHPVDDKTPSPTTWMHCNERLQREIAAVNPTKIITVGGVGLSALKASTKALPITKWRGQGFMMEIAPDGSDDRTSVFTVPTFHPSAVLRDPDLFRDFIEDIEKAVTKSEPEEFEIIEVMPESIEEIINQLQILWSTTAISCDLETTGFDFLSDTLISVGFGAMTTDGKGYSVIIKRELLQHADMKMILKDFWQLYPGVMVFHNIKFDVKFIQTWLGFQPEFMNPMDTMLMKYAQDERPYNRYASHGLKSIARVRYDVPDYHFSFDEWFKVPDAERDWEALWAYHAQDCYITIRLYYELLDELRNEDPKLIDLVERVLVPGTLAFAKIEHHGVLIDIPYFEKMHGEVAIRLAEWEEYLIETAKLWGIENLNPKSSLQVNKIIFGELELEGRTTEREELQALVREVRESNREDRDTVVQWLTVLLDHRQWSKIQATYIEGLLEKVHPVDGRVHPDFLLHGTSTGRLSCNEPNLQNIPILMGEDIRRGFVAPPGYVFVGADYSQLELRVAGYLSKDETLIKAYEADQDIHKIVASKMYKKPVEEITKLERYMAKYIDFGIIYGRGAKSLTEGWEMEHYVTVLGGDRWSLKQSEIFIDEFLKGFPGLNAWIKEQHMFVAREGYTNTPFGRRRRFPLRDSTTIYGIQRQAVNTPIQSMASDICLTAATRLVTKLPEGAYLLFSVHDALYFEVREDLLEGVCKLISDEMAINLPEEIDTTIIPFRVDIEVGCNWGDALKRELQE